MQHLIYSSRIIIFVYEFCDYVGTLLRFWNLDVWESLYCKLSDD